VAFSPDGKTMASAGGDGAVWLWDVVTRKQIGQLLTGHKYMGFGVAFSPDGKTIASVGCVATVWLWDVATGNPIGQPLTGNKYVGFRVAFSPDSKTIASVGSDATVWLWDVATGEPIGRPLTDETGYAFRESMPAVAFKPAMAFSPDGNTIASSFGGTVGLWDLARRSFSRMSQEDPLPSPRTSVVMAGMVISLLVSLLATGIARVRHRTRFRLLASAGFDGKVRLWDLPSREPLTGDALNSVAVSPDGRLLAVAGFEGKVRLWDVASGQALGQPITDDRSVNSVAFSPDGKLLASGNENSKVRLWDVTSRQPVGQPQTLNDDRGLVTLLAFSSDGRFLAAVTDNGTVGLWDSAGGQFRVLGTISPPTGTPVAFAGVFIRSLPDRIAHLRAGARFGRRQYGET
jgi:WD40 repeat protein